MDNECELAGFGTNVNGKVIQCGGGIQNHHLLSRSKLTRVLKRDRKAKKYVEETHAEIFICKVCAVHNAATKIADSPAARRKLVKGKEEIFGLEYVRDVIDGFQDFLKVPEPMWTHRGIKACPLP